MNDTPQEAVVQSVAFDLGNGSKIELQYGKAGEHASNRQCGTCSACCRLLPVPEIGKPGQQRCRHQRARQPCCAIYGQEFFPRSCASWSCRWLVDPDFHLPRPDRAHYVVDILPDSIAVTEDSRVHHVPVVQIWIDPDHRDAHRDPRLRAWLAEVGRTMGMAAIVRDDAKPGPGLVLIPPCMSQTGDFLEKKAQLGKGAGLWGRP